VSWLEPARAFVKSLNQAQSLLQGGDKAEMTTFLKQIGSNHILIDKSISFSAQKPFEMLAERRQSRREATSYDFAKSAIWRRVVDDVRTYWQNPSNWFFIPKLSAESAITV